MLQNNTLLFPFVSRKNSGLAITIVSSSAPITAYLQKTGALWLILALVIWLGVSEDEVDYGIPGVVDTDKEEQDGGGTDDEEREHWIGQEHNSRNQESGIGRVLKLTN